MAEAADRGGHAPTQAVKNRIFAATREAIVNRQLQPGAKLTEDVIAAIFGCGRGPVRWALARLGDEGLVTLVPHRGAFVATPPLNEAKQLFGARRMLEGGVVRCLCCSPPKDGWGALIGCVDAEDRAQSEEGLAVALRLSGDFHLILAELTGNPIVAGMLRELVSRTVLAIAVHQRPDASGCRTHEHRRIIDLLRAGDAEGAAREMDDHLVALDAGLDVAPQPRNNLSLRDVLQAIVNSHPR